MASYSYNFTAGDSVTPTKLNAARTVSEIVNADIASAAAIDKTKISGTAITAADTGTVTSAMIADGTIVNADINAAAAIAGTKIAPDFGSQNVTTTGAGTFNTVHSSGAAAYLQMSETDASTDNKRWDIVASDEAMLVRAVNDAYTNASNAIEIQRSATAIDSVSMPNGNVGIGTSSPTVKLDVNGGIASSTTVPLHIKGSNFKYITCESDHLAFYKKSGAYDFYFRKSDDGTQNGSNSAELMIIKDSGNVGIGTASPSTKLEVNGTVTATAFAGNVTGNLTGTASAVADGSVTDAKIASGVDASKLTTGTLPIARIADAAVTAAKLNGAQTGSAPIYGCRAWVYFDGQTDSSGNSNTSNTNRQILGSGNVSSVTKTGVGAFTVNFATAMGGSNYASVITHHSTVSGSALTRFVAKNSSDFQFITTDAGGSASNAKFVNVLIFE